MPAGVGGRGVTFFREVSDWLAHSLWAADASRLLLATLLGGSIGFQREYEGRPAGLRTHVLVCVGACLMSMIRFGSGDPGRISAQVVTGVGFLGAGVILRRGLAIRGLTTAATVWIVAGIGLAVGAGGRNTILATVATGISLVTLTLVKKIEERIRSPFREASLLLTVPRGEGFTRRAINALTESGAIICGLESEDSPTAPDRRLLVIRIRLEQNATRQEILSALGEAFPTVPVEWE